MPKRQPEKTNKAPKRAGKPKSNWRKDFINELRKMPVVSLAAQAAGVSRATVYRIRQEDEEFKAEWDDAVEESIDSLEAEAFFRGRDGIEYPVVVGDDVVWIRRPSDKLLLRILEAKRPSEWAPAIAKEMAEAKLKQAMKSERVRIVFED